MAIALQLHRVVNITTDVSLVPKGVKSLEVIQFSGETFSFLTSIKVALDQFISIEGKARFEQHSISFNAIGKIVGVSSDDVTSCVEVKLHQFDEEIWAKIRQFICAKQERADWIFRSIKGYG